MAIHIGAPCWLSLYASQALFKSGAHRAKMRCRSEGVLSLWGAIQSLVNDLLTRKGEGTEPGKSPGAPHPDVQRSGCLWLTFLLWTANK